FDTLHTLDILNPLNPLKHLDISLDDLNGYKKFAMIEMIKLNKYFTKLVTPSYVTIPHDDDISEIWTYLKTNTMIKNFSINHARNLDDNSFIALADLIKINNSIKTVAIESYMTSIDNQ